MVFVLGGVDSVASVVFWLTCLRQTVPRVGHLDISLQLLGGLVLLGLATADGVQDDF